MQREHHLDGVVGPLRGEQPVAHQGAEPFGLLVLGVGKFGLQRLGEQAEVLAQADMVACEVAERRGQVVRGDRGHAVLAPAVGGQRLAVLVCLEPQHGGAEDAAARQVVTHPRLDGAEVLADDQRLGALRLQREDADHCLVVVADVGADRGAATLRDPPQPEQADDVVHAQAADAAQRGRDHGAERSVGQFAELVWAPRGLAPVLARLVVLVRGRADAHPGGEHVGHHPGLGAEAVHADREVGDDPDGHADLGCGGLRVGDLALRDPLQPFEEVDVLGVLLCEPGDLG